MPSSCRGKLGTKGLTKVAKTDPHKASQQDSSTLNIPTYLRTACRSSLGVNLAGRAGMKCASSSNRIVIWIEFLLNGVNICNLI